MRRMAVNTGLRCVSRNPGSADNPLTDLVQRHTPSANGTGVDVERASVLWHNGISATQTVIIVNRNAITSCVNCEMAKRAWFKSRLFCVAHLVCICAMQRKEPGRFAQKTAQI